MLLMAVGLSTLSPAPVAGRVSFQYSDSSLAPAVDQSVILKNLRSLETVSVKTSNAGEFMVDWANTVQKYQPGDAVTVSVLGITRSVQLPDVDVIFITVNSECPPSITCPTCPDCPTCPEPVACDSCCSDCPICPISSPSFDWTNFFAGGITVLAVFLGSAAVYFKAGKARLQVYKKYIKADGTIGKKYVTITALNWNKVKDNEVI